jgi:hypothetical protein
VGDDADGGLRRAVVVGDAAPRREVLDTIDEIPARGVPAEDEELPGQDLLRARRGEQGAEVGGDDLEDVDPLADEVSAEPGRVGGQLLGDHVQRPPEAERREEHRVAEVGREGGDVGVPRPLR